MGQSLNLYLAAPSGKRLHDMYLLAWHKGLKTTYYLRTLAATQIEKSTLDVNRWAIQPRWMKARSASADVRVERTAACDLDSACEACQ
jgi:ribonucleoside-diphosphate reductase alpha chain